MTIAAILSTKGNEVCDRAAGTPVRDAVSLLAEQRIGAVPVLDGSGICGIFSERDLVRCVSDHGPDALDWPVDRAMSSPAETVDTSYSDSRGACDDDPTPDAPFAGG